MIGKLLAAMSAAAATTGMPVYFWVIIGLSLVTAAVVVVAAENGYASALAGGVAFIAFALMVIMLVVTGS